MKKEEIIIRINKVGGIPAADVDPGTAPNIKWAWKVLGEIG
jgi:hypothetical protein